MNIHIYHVLFLASTLFSVFIAKYSTCIYAIDQTNQNSLSKNIKNYINIEKQKTPQSFNSAPTKTSHPKKRILILSSIGGGGHTAVSKALQYYLRDYEVIIAKSFQDIFSTIDSLQILTFGKICAEDFYNFCLQSRWVNVIKKLNSVGSWVFRQRQQILQEAFTNYLERSPKSFDLIISIIPVINFALIPIAQKYNIPFLILTNDLDTTNYINGISAPQYKKFYYTLPFKDSLIREKITSAHLPPDRVKIIGFPLRPDFFKPKNIPQIKKDFAIPDNKQVVMILMGGAGSLSAYRYVKTLSRFDIPMHLVVCLGNNERIRRSVNKIILPAHITLTLVSFTERIADLMAISNVLITKPGPGSLCEALASALPLIIDKTSGTLWWELTNIDFVLKYGFGDVLTTFKDLRSVLSKHIVDTKYYTAIKQKMLHFKKQHIQEFEYSFKNLINEILSN